MNVSTISRSAEALRPEKLFSRKLVIFSAVILLLSTGSATDIVREDVTIDLGDSKVDAEIVVGDLTSNAFTYITTKEVSGVNGSIDGETINCDVRSITLGSEIRCDTDRSVNFTVDLSYTAEDLSESRGDAKIFQYQHPIYRPTQSYSLEVILPEGSALMNRNNDSQQVISPLGGETNTNGRQISVTWEQSPDLGQSLSFYVLYEELAPSEEQPGLQDYREVALIILGLLAVGGLAFLIRRRINDRNHEEELPELDEDEKEIIELLKDNDGEYLQKDVVEELDYSKAKISGIVSDLVEKGVIEKEKEGRSNKLVIPEKYSY